ncbi:SCP-2 sterol transfer family protein [Rhizoctonia solani 123E]|uniref:SCP-2 sterol transfer family protein n=1 Tax=Rhizoctonia solani 123E TaxID=1423351 RepID=A0A074S4Z8_9AGAM|nr:SCP-2 sterol transfer family protein [Rhizoctonia solani 123E]
MSDLKEPGFAASNIIAGLGDAFDHLSEAQKKAQIKKTNGIFELRVSKDEKEATWTIDLKKEGAISKGPATGKPDVAIILSETLTELATGKLNGQKAFLTGRLKTKGKLAT